MQSRDAQAGDALRSLVRLCRDAENRMVGGDAAQLSVGRIRSDAAEEGADLPFPLLQVGAQQGWLLVVAALGCGEGFGPAAQRPAASAAGPPVSHPLGASARGPPTPTP